MYETGAFQLNSLVKEWMATGIHVWTEEEAILFLQKGQSRYLIGGTTNDNVTDANSYVLAQLATNALAGATSVTLQTAVGISDQQYFGITLDSGFVQWTKVSGAPVGNTVSIPTPLLGNAAALNFAFAYTTKLIRPLKVPRTRLLTFNGLQETPMEVMSRKEYMDLPNKTNPGTPTQFFYTPQLVSGEFYAWPNPSQGGVWGARFTWYRPIDDILSPANTMDFPTEWGNALIWNLAKELAPEFDVPPQRWAMIKEQAQTKLDMVISWDREPEPIMFGLGYDEGSRY